MSHSTVNVCEIMRDVHTISKDVTFREALAEMIDKKTNALVAVDEDGRFFGLVNARVFIEQAIPSYMRNDTIAAHYADADLFREAVEKVADAPLVDFMENDIQTIRENESIMRAAVIATQNRQIRIPVLDVDGAPIGLLTRTEMKQLIGTFLHIEADFGDK